jgi:hypothetical protein
VSRLGNDGASRSSSLRWCFGVGVVEFLCQCVASPGSQSCLSLVFELGNDDSRWVCVLGREALSRLFVGVFRRFLYRALCVVLGLVSL